MRSVVLSRQPLQYGIDPQEEANSAPRKLFYIFEQFVSGKKNSKY